MRTVNPIVCIVNDKYSTYLYASVLYKYDSDCPVAMIQPKRGREPFVENFLANAVSALHIMTSVLRGLPHCQRSVA